MNEQKVKRPYGVYVLRCECGWHTTSNKSAPDPPTKCEACGKDGESKLDSEVACVVATVADIRSRRVIEHAAKSDLMVVQLSKNRWIVVRNDGAAIMNFSGGNEPKESRAYNTMEVVFGPGDWQQTANYIKKKTEPLPEYLSRP